MTGAKTPMPIEGSADQARAEKRRVRVDVESTSKPEPGPERDTYRCDADIRISEGGEHQVCRARLTVHHPRGWMGVSTGFTYEVDSREFPTFASRAEFVCLEVMKEFPSDEIVSVFLLGTGDLEFGNW